MSIINKIWNSKALEVMAEANYEVLKGIGNIAKDVAEIGIGTLECLGECMCEAFSKGPATTSTSYCGDCGSDNIRKSVEEETYEYWKGLSSTEQEEYFERNYKLQEYGENYRYNNREQMAKSVAEIARKENRAFTDKYDQY